MPDYTDEYLIHNPDVLNEHNSEHAAADYDKATSYWEHPMTDTQAKSLLARIRSAFEYRNGVIDQNTRWKPQETPAITASINNIDLTKNPDTNEYNIEANDNSKDAIDNCDIMPEASLEYLDKVIRYIGENVSIYQKNKFYKCVEDSGSYSWIEFDPIDTSSANIIKAIDGIAIINSILRINEIDNGIDDVANTSYKKIKKAFENGQSYKNHIKNYTLNGVLLTDLFPAATDTDIAAAKDRYLNVIDVNVNSNDFNFESDDIAEREAQRRYIFTVLDDISDIIKYVKNFTSNYVTPLADGTDVHQNITSAFDYYLLDYIVQMIEAENILFDTLLTKYEKTIITNTDRSTRITIPLNVQRKQYNHAPFIGSMCNGACTGLCFGSCESTCNGCGGCTGYCSSYCGGSCYGQCGSAMCDKSCTGTCKNECQNECQGQCTKQCADQCSSGCTGACTTQCKDSCKGKCSTSCDNACISGCNDGCYSSCTGSCGQSCSGSASSKNPISKNQPNDTKTIITDTLNPYHVSDTNSNNSSSSSGNSTCRDQCGAQCGACGGSCTASCGGCGASCSGYCGVGCSATCGAQCSKSSGTM